MRKKLLLILSTTFVVLIGIAALSAFEAHVINVTADIVNALRVSSEELSFGTVVPQEYLEKNFSLSLSQSFLAEAQLVAVEYDIIQKPKPKWPEPVECAQGFEDVEQARRYCISNPGNFDCCYFSLCPFLSKKDGDPEDNNDISAPSYFQGDHCIIPGEASGRLNQDSGDIIDDWIIDLKVPPIKGTVGQDWPEDCPTILEEAKYGCDLWVEVTGVLREGGEIECIEDSDCNDYNSCTIDLCEAGSCYNTCSVGQPCDDGNPNTINDTCILVGDECQCLSESGNLVVSLAADTPVSQAYVKGSVAKPFTKINLTAASGEDIAISSVTVRCYEATGTDDTCDLGEVSNIKLIKFDGTQFGSTFPFSLGYASFSGSLTIPAGETKALTVVADVPSGSTASYLRWDLPGAGTTSDDITSTGVSSATDITEIGSATGNRMTIGQGSLTISTAAMPGDQTSVIGASEVPFVGLVMTAGTDEDIRVTKVVLKRSVLVGQQGSSTDISNIALWEGTTRLTVKKGWDAADDTEVTFTASDFLNSSEIDISKGQQKVITVKGDIPSTGVADHYVAIGIATSSDPGSSTTTEVTIVGLSSNTYLAPTLVKANPALEGVNYSSVGHSSAYYVHLWVTGILTLARSADTPLEQIQSVSIAGIQIPGVSFLKTYLKSSLELIDMKTITIERKGGAYSRDSDFTSISLYDGDGNLIAAPQALANASTTFNLVPDDGDGVWEQGEYWRIPIVGTKNLIVKATLNGIAAATAPTGGSLTGDVPILCIDNTTAEGVNSGVPPTTGTGVPTIDICSNVQIIRQGQPTIALGSPTSGTYGAGTKELIRWTVSADQMSSLSWKKVVFDISGSITIGTDSYTVGCVVGNPSCFTVTDTIHMSTSDDPVATSLIATSSMQIWDANTNTEVQASTTGNSNFRIDQATASGTARVSFVAYPEQVIAAGATKTYYLLGNIQRAGKAGDSLMTKIAARSTATSSLNYADTASTDATFVWSDNSGASTAAHSYATGDWTDDYKVIGIPTATKTLSK